MVRFDSPLNRGKTMEVLKREYLNNEEYRGTFCDAIEDILLFLKWRKPKWYVGYSNG